MGDFDAVTLADNIERANALLRAEVPVLVQEALDNEQTQGR